MPTKYYRVDGGRLSFAEYWRMSPNFLTFLMAAGMKPFGGFPFNFSIPRIDELHYLKWEELPKGTQKALSAPVGQLKQAKFELAFCHELPLLESHRYGAGAILLDAKGKSFFVVGYAKDGDNRKVELNCVSWFGEEDIEWGITTTAKKQLKPRDDYVIERHPEAEADELYDYHREHLKQWESDGYLAQHITRDKLPELILKGEQRTVDFHADRRVFVPMSKSEVRALRDEEPHEE